MTIRPLLAVEADLPSLRYPVLVSPKIDGIRGVITSAGILQSRSGKPIANHYTQQKFSSIRFANLDGELCVGAPHSPTLMRDTQSALSTITGAPRVTFHVFDYVDTHSEFLHRDAKAKVLCADLRAQGFDYIHHVEHTLIANEAELLAYEAQTLRQGYEGIMIRAPRGRYKYGRSTLREAILLKLKRFATTEAKIIGFEELLVNNNRPRLDERGYQVRSSHQENLHPAGVLGALIVDWHGFPLHIGTGFDAFDREVLWKTRASLVGKSVTFKYLPHGMKDLPRHPVFLSIRSEFDL